MNRRPNYNLLGRLKLRQRLGEGAMGEVFLAEMSGPSGFSRLVAVKQIRPQLADRPEFIQVILNEARLGGWLNHPNIVQTLALQRHNGCYRLVMEYVEGVPLDAVIRFARETERTIPMGFVLDVARQLTDGLHYAHMVRGHDGRSMNMIHRDLKPQNILMGTTGVAKIADFGMAVATTPNCDPCARGGLRGTLAYMSPEQGRCEPLDSRSDLYALGAILYELITLERLRSHASGLTALDQVQAGMLDNRLELLDEHPAVLRELISRLLEPEACRRPRTALDVRRSLGECMAQLPHAYWEDPYELIQQVRAHFQTETELTLPSTSGSSEITTLPFPAAGMY